ncbi:hypothetical protein [Nocardiopsis sp. LOL_012]|uniref:hypothetical protein n=1 Tax=Nocardiopsis sp. LOL_012 TaxID=3345409 RepID=UPI003A85A63E
MPGTHRRPSTGNLFLPQRPERTHHTEAARRRDLWANLRTGQNRAQQALPSRYQPRHAKKETPTDDR